MPPIQLRAIIVEDVPRARNLLKMMLEEHLPFVEVCDAVGDIPSAVESINAHQPDIVFLDIELPGESGLQLFEHFDKADIGFEVIFTTAYNQYAISAFRLSAIDYLLKPIEETQLIEAVNKVSNKQKLTQAEERLKVLSQNLNGDQERTLCIPIQYGYDYLPLKSISHIEAQGAYTCIHLNNGQKKTISKNLKYFENTLSDIPIFVRVHRSFLINTAYLKGFSRAEGGSVLMQDGTSIAIARNRKADFMKILEDL